MVANGNNKLAELLDQLYETAPYGDTIFILINFEKSLDTVYKTVVL